MPQDFSTGQVLTAAQMDTLSGAVDGYATTATAAGTTTLTTASLYQQFFTGSTTQSVVMPVTTTLYIGQKWRIVNNSSGIVTVKTSDSTTIYAVPAGGDVIFTCILASGTTAASWDYKDYKASAGSGGMTLITTTTIDNTVGTYTYSSLGSYKHILILGQNVGHNQTAASSQWNMKFNSDGSSIYGYSNMMMNGTTYSGLSSANQTTKIILSDPAGSMISAGNAADPLDGGEFEIFIPNYGSSIYGKSAYWKGGSAQDGTRCMTTGTGRWSSTAAITSITLYMTTGNFSLGTIYVYGVS